MNLRKLITIENPEHFKVHLATWNGEVNPLDVFIRDREEWKDWNSWRSSKDDFNRQFILSLIDYYPNPGTWLFGGVFEVIARGGESHAHSYDVKLDEIGAELIGRLKIRFQRPGRIKSLKLENYVEQLQIAELLSETYTGEPFPGYEGINHDFSYLESIFRANRPDWRAALLNVKGVYVIFDKSNGKKYVGSAYGGAGIWSRWATYIGTGHGHNDELTSLIDEHGKEYAQKNFRFCLLEYRPAKTDDRVIIERESFWKVALLSRGAFGYNGN